MMCICVRGHLRWDKDAVLELELSLRMEWLSAMRAGAGFIIYYITGVISARYCNPLSVIDITATDSCFMIMNPAACSSFK